MEDIRRLSNSSIGVPNTAAFIHFINGWEPEIHQLWYYDIDGICHKVHTEAHVDIPDGTVGEFVTEYISKNGQRNHIIGELSINGSVQFIGIS